MEKNRFPNQNVVLAEYLANVAIWTGDGYHAEVRLNDDAPLEVGSRPTEFSQQNMKNAFMAICREKLMSDITSWNALAEKVKADKNVDLSVSFEEVLDFVSKQQAKVIEPPKKNDAKAQDN